MKSFYKLFKIEFKLNLKDMNMVLFAIIMPIVIFVIFGIVNKDNLAYAGANYTYIEQTFPAISTIAICAGGLMGLPMVISEYRERKILKRFQVTPMSPVKLLFIEFLIYVIYSVVSLITLILIGVIFFKVDIKGSWIGFLGAFFLTMITTLLVGLFVGGIAKNSKSAGVIASVLYFPMLLLSGTTIPLESMPEILKNIVSVFPLTQGILLLKDSFLNIGGNIWLPITVMSVFGIILTFLTVKTFKWE